MKDKDLEQIISENLSPKNRTSDDDCAKCALYDFADVCRRFACTNSNNVFSVYWSVNEKGGVLGNDVLERLRNESADRVLMSSKAMILKHCAKNCGR